MRVPPKRTTDLWSELEHYVPLWPQPCGPEDPPGGLALPPAVWWDRSAQDDFAPVALAGMGEFAFVGFPFSHELALQSVVLRFEPLH